MKVVKTEYNVALRGAGAGMKIAVVADLHNSAWGDVLKIIADSTPDIIVCPGDMFGSLAGADANGVLIKAGYLAESRRNHISFEFLKAARQIAPVYSSVGNHEVCVSDANRRTFAALDVVLLADSCVILLNAAGTKSGAPSYSRIFLGGLSSGGSCGLFGKSPIPNLEWLEKFAALNGTKILLCHHPEYWKNYIAGKGIDLVVSGHAHGGQWRFFGRGLLAPGQGLFPKYTSGVHEKDGSKLVISRGLLKKFRVPRINNRPEVVIINIE